jgi:hypothetical protein
MRHISNTPVAVRVGLATVAALVMLGDCHGAEAPWYLLATDTEKVHSVASGSVEGLVAGIEATPAEGRSPAFPLVSPPPASLPREAIRRVVAPGQPYGPLTNSQKARMQLLSTFDRESMARIAFISGFAMLRGAPREWPRTAGGYGWRYADRLGRRLVYKQVQFTLGSVLLKEDPRYFRSETPSHAGRLKSALKQTWMVRRDDGRWAPAYGTFAGSFVAGAVSSRWQPERRQQWESIVIRSTTQIGMQFCSNLVREYLPLIRRKSKH